MVGETSTVVIVVAGTLMVQLMILALNLVPCCAENEREKEKEGVANTKSRERWMELPRHLRFRKSDASEPGHPAFPVGLLNKSHL